jgi:two-component system nitrogen regulation response regulator GlnG
MASSKEIDVCDLPPELGDSSEDKAADDQWLISLRQWARKGLQQGHTALLATALPAFERILIEVALEHTAGRRQEAARLLGWGRNTLTRKVKDLRLETDDAQVGD